jgi:hypothetical protein
VVLTIGYRVNKNPDKAVLRHQQVSVSRDVMRVRSSVLSSVRSNRLSRPTVTISISWFGILLIPVLSVLSRRTAKTWILRLCNLWWL